MHRLFAAIRPPRDIRDICLEAMTDGPAGWAWQDDEQLHLTLRFIGEVDRHQASDIVAALGTLRSAPTTCQLAGVGRFDSGKGVLFARVTPAEPLATLHRKVDRLVASTGLQPERRRYFPHITLARGRRGAETPLGWLERHSGLVSPPFAGEHVVLYESVLGKNGATYEPVERFALS